MDDPIQTQIRQQNQNMLLKFLEGTHHLTDEVAENIKATMCQFLMGIKKDLSIRYYQDTGISPDELYQVQITSLRECIIDIQSCLNIIITGRGPLQ